MPKGQLWFFLVLTFLLTWVLWLPLIIFSPPLIYFHQIGALGPLTAAFISVFIFNKKSEIPRFVQQIFSFHFKWVLFAFLLPFVLLFISAVIYFFINGSVPNIHLLFQSTEYPQVGIWYWIVSIIFYGFGEQVGWRGYALPKMVQNGMSAFYASTVLSIIWAVWHLPLFFYINSNFKDMNVGAIIGWYISILLSSYLLTWIYNTSKRSVVAVAVFHGTIDIIVTSQFTQGTMIQIMSVLLMLLGVLVLVLSGKSLKDIK